MPKKKKPKKKMRVRGTVPMRRQKTPPQGQGPITPGPIVPDDDVTYDEWGRFTGDGE